MSAPTAPVAQAHAGAGATETAARDRIAPRAGTLRARVLAAVVAAGDRGLTATEATERLGYGLDRLYSVAPRLSELERAGFVHDSGHVRGRRQAYTATVTGRAWAAREVAA